MKTLAEFKKALQTPGVKVETLALASTAKPGRLRVGQIRFVNKFNTVGVYLKEEGAEGSGSYLDYGKASEWVFEGLVAKNTKYGYAYKIILPEKAVA